MKRKFIIPFIVISLLLTGCTDSDKPKDDVSYSALVKYEDFLSESNPSTEVNSADTSSVIDNVADNEHTSFSSVEEARKAVVDKWRSSGKAYECAKFVEDIYKQCYFDDTIANIYYYVMAKQQYDSYIEHPNYEGYREELERATLLIDPEYNGELSDEIIDFVNEIFPYGINYQQHNEATSKQNNYDTMTTSEKKRICEYIQSRYDYYDRLEGRQTGDKYSDQIWQEVMDNYGLEEWQVSVIWMNYYSY